MKLRDSDGYYTNRHSCFLLQYHLVLVTKYRNPVLRGRVADGMREYIKRYFSDRGLPVHAFDIQQDHIHILFDAPPQLELAAFVNALKSGSSRRIRSDYPSEVSKYYWKPLFWSNSYFICTVSERSAEIVKRYIENQ